MDAKRLLVFNVTQDEVDALWVAQGGKCAVCQRPIKLDSPATCLDHDHDIGVLRGLLCFLCNRALGLLQDDVERVKAARAYLTAPPAYRVLGQRYACIGRAKVRTVPRSRRAYFFPYGTVPSAPALRTPTVYRQKLSSRGPRKLATLILALLGFTNEQNTFRTIVPSFHHCRRAARPHGLDQPA